MQHPIFTSFLRDLETHAKGMELDEIHRYHIACWESCKSVYTAIKKLYIAESCIVTSSQQCAKEYAVAEYVEFHIENYFIRSRSIYDRILQFVNCLLDIQMSRESVNHPIIITNKKVESSKVKDKLKRINKACGSYRSIRNTVIHHDKYKDERLEWVDTALKAKHILDGDLNCLGIDQREIDNRLNIMVTDKLEEFHQNTVKLAGIIDDFMNDAKDIHDQKAVKT